MKATFFSISFLLILIVSLFKCHGETLPFSKGKYIYWLGLLTVTAIVFVVKNGNKTLKFNTYDGIVSVLLFFGLINFIWISNATKYSISIWYYTGYITIYLLLRSYCNTVELNQKALKLLLYFCSLTSLVNVFWMFLQWKLWVTPTNNYFTTTGLFFSPNHLGLFLSIGCLCSLFLFQKTAVLWLKTSLALTILLLLCGIIVSESRGAIISLSIALGYFFYQSKIKLKQNWNWKTYVGIGIFLLGSIYYTVTISKDKVDSTSGRYFTTQQILKQITQNPLGYGVNSFSVEYNKGKAQYFENNHNWAEMKNAGYIFYANNDYLELAFELGIHWIILFIVFIFLLFKKSDTTIETLLCRTILLCFIIFSLTNSILSGPVFVITAVISISLIINRSNSKTLFESNTNFLYKPITMGLLLFAIFIQIGRINAENNLRRLYQGNKYLKGENQLQGFLSKIEEKGEEYFMSGIILVNNGYKKEGIHYMQIGVQRSGKPSLGRILSEGLQKQGNYAQAESIYTYNKNAEPYRYEARMDLFDLYLKTNQIGKAKAMALEITKLPVKVPSQKIVDFKRMAKLYLKNNN